ncbi:hypothetical protein ACTRW9_02305 [Nitrospina sp. 32_T5]|uniref:hypothetical protein n=1 Tax=unclassified Nitrospina TaxID=2638683 RepID=UPI003F95E172
MFLKNSRYLKSKPFVPDETGQYVFQGYRPRAIGSVPGVIEHVIQEGDRLDLLARHYYNDDRLWYRIVDANPEVLFSQDLSGDIGKGRVILIPRARE